MVYALVLALAIPTYGPAAAPTPSTAASLRIPAVPAEALIVNSGSTNRTGYRLYVYADGTTALQQGDTSTKKHVSAALVKRFFADLKAAGPLDALTSVRCMKSASFGSTTQVGYLGKMSSDVSCPGSPAMRALEVDAGALADAAGVSMLPRTGT
jgi:hypothetical protein